MSKSKQMNMARSEKRGEKPNKLLAGVNEEISVIH